MVRSFVTQGSPVRVVFGAGTLDRLREEVERLGLRRVLLISGRSRPSTVDRAAANLGELVAARFDGAVMHTPVDVTERALALVPEREIDGFVAVGGGSATGLGKALARRTGLPQLVVPTTYAGSEVTPQIGETADGVKTTRSGPEILPRTVLYDVELTLDLPVPLTVTSGINALAHAVEALWSPGANPMVDEWAVRAITLLTDGLRRVVRTPGDVEARADTLTGAWLAGLCLGTVPMGLHHKLCHTLGGAFDLPHSETHTVLLPHAIAYNAPAAPAVMHRIAGALGAPSDPARAVYDLVVELGGPTSLRELGLKEDQLAVVPDLATRQPYPNPCPVTPEGIAALVHDAWAGIRPPSAAGDLTDQVVASFDRSPDPRLRELLGGLVRHLHAFAREHDVTQDEWQHAVDFLTRTGHASTGTRQEFVLLSDTLGVSSVVDLLTNSRTPDTTPSAVLGPFYVDGPPELPLGADLSGGQRGTPLWVDVEVRGPAGPVAGAVVDVWQSNEDGFYDVQLPDVDGPVLRGRLRSDADGRVRFWSILPSEYPIPTDGPVGRLLAATGRHPYRAPHLHFLIEAPGHPRLITQLFVAGGAYLDSDTVFGVKDALIVDFAPGTGTPPPGRPIDADWRHLTYTFHLA